MRILFDQGTPVQIRKSLSAHSVRTARQQGWSTLANGDLLREAEAAGFDLLLTPDKNLQYQQNLAGRKIAIVVLGNGLWPFVKPVLSQVLAAIEAATPGSITNLEVPRLDRR